MNLKSADKEFRVRHSALAPYAIAALCVGLGTILRLRLDEILGNQYTYVTFYLALLVSAGLGGWRSGFTALVLGILSASYFFTPSRHTLSLGDVPHRIGLMSFIIVGSTAVCLSDAQRRARSRARLVILQLEREIAERKQAEKELHETHALAQKRLAELDAVIESMPDAVYIGNESGITKCNSHALNMLGVSSLEELHSSIGVVGDKFSIRWPHNNQRLKPEEFQFIRALEGQTVIEEVLASRLKTEETVHLRVASAPVVFNGGIIGAVAITSNITDQRRKEAFTSVLSHLGEKLNTARTQPEAGRLIADVTEHLFEWDAFSLNLYNLETRGLKPILNIDTLEGQKTEIPSDLLGISPTISRAMAQGAELLLRDFPLTNTTDCFPFGDVSRLSASLIFVPVRDGNQSIGVLSIQSYQHAAYDEKDLGTLQILADYCGGALQRIRAEEALQDSEKEYRAMFDMDGSGKAQVDPLTHKFLRVNPKLCEISGYAQEEMLEKTFPEIILPEDRRHNLVNFQDLIAGRRDGCRYEIRHLRKDGAIRRVDITITILRDADSQPVRVLSSLIDVTERKQAEEALRLSEQQYRTFTETVPAIVFTGGAERACDYLNQRWTDYTGLTIEQSLGDGWRSALHPEDLQPTAQRWLEARQEKKPFEWLYRYRRKDGMYRWFLMRSQPFFDDAGNICRWLGTAIDIHDRKEAEDALRESERRFSSFMQHLPGTAWIKDLEGRYIYINANGCKVFSRNVEEIVGQRDDAFFPATIADRLRENDQVVIETGRSLQTIEAIPFAEELRYCLVSKFPILGNNGSPAFVAAIAVDITERKRGEEALAFSNQRLSLLAQVTHTVVGVGSLKDEVGKLAEIVRSAYHVDACVIRVLQGDKHVLLASAGLDERELEPSIPSTLGIGGALSALKRPVFVPDVRLHPLTQSLENRLGKDYNFLSYAGTPLLIQDRLIGILGIYSAEAIRHFSEADLEHLQIIAHDLAAAIVNDNLFREVSTQKRQLEEHIAERQEAEMEIQRLNAELEKRVQERTAQLQASNKELEAFCYSVSHDLRWPLRTITGFTQALRDDYADRLDTDGQEYLERVINAGREMDRLINDLLHLSRLTRSEMRLRRVDLSALAQRIAGELNKTEPLRNVEFVISPGLAAQGDERLLRIALENLLNNAWKFTGNRSLARIEFGIDLATHYPAYFVRDNGAGFDMAYAAKLFGAFQRLHSAEEFPGHGIGLATVQRIVNRHGGRTWATGAINEGATFYFTLPT
ncbi:PAS domain S-box protein [Pedosphaera parvula]|uniref:histidine kinase n=1 Tax=Pedosphaera parvula (strain Ellin514) TaxID=320771 RepID=B9XQ92_PEDPL|nr:PAS domain S-box protein [Pedosphaera parvula]EEF58010.1 multi-sensor signal transduction histidine kinase [Pedosphaera parvula Ellin514]